MKQNSGGIEVGSANLADLQTGKKTVREVGVGSGDADQSVDSISLLPQEKKEFADWAYGDYNLVNRERQLKKQVSLGDLMRAKRVEECPKSKIARSRSLAMLGKSTSKTKNGVIQTKALFQGIHRTKDVRPPVS